MTGYQKQWRAFLLSGDHGSLASSPPDFLPPYVRLNRQTPAMSFPDTRGLSLPRESNPAVSPIGQYYECVDPRLRFSDPSAEMKLRVESFRILLKKGRCRPSEDQLFMR
jgi:hypothetical protein